MEGKNEFAPFFLGAYAENNDVFEESLLEFYRDHIYWRRGFHPEDPPPIAVTTKYQHDYLTHIGKTKQALHRLTAKLKQSVPFYHPRYIGHMSSDLMMSGLLAQMITTLYNPNNVSLEAAPVTVELEKEYGLKLAEMFGYNIAPEAAERAFGHLTSGGTVANYQGLWYARAMKYYPLAIQSALKRFPSFKLQIDGKPLNEKSAWELFNLSFDQIIELKKTLADTLSQVEIKQQNKIVATIEESRIEHLGCYDFHQQYADLKPPVVLVPATAHYSWKKSVKLLGIGTAQLVQVPTDKKMRICARELDVVLKQLIAQQQPILAVIGVLGTTEFGTIDPIDELVQQRENCRRQGLDFHIHVDAAWGGFLTTMFRAENGSFLPYEKVAKPCKYFPSQVVYNAFKAIAQVETITVDPHKLGYLPFGCGAFVCRRQEAREFVTQSAAYVFDTPHPGQDDMQLGQYILEGSKPGAMAAGASVAQEILPFHANAMGRLLVHSIQSTEYFFDKLTALNEKLSHVMHINMPIEPDSNLLCLAINLRDNRSTAAMNRLMRSIFDKLNVDLNNPLQNKLFLASCTSIYRKHLSGSAASTICANLNLDETTFVLEPESPDQADHIFVLRHTLMNPWLITEAGNYIDKYTDYLEQEMLNIISKFA